MSAAGGLICSLGEISAGSSQLVTRGFRAITVGEFDFASAVQVDDDTDSVNNTFNGRIEVQVAVDLSLQITGTTANIEQNASADIRRTNAKC